MEIRQKYERAKQHLKDNKKTYIACAGTAVVAAVGTFFATRKATMTVGDQDITQVLSWKPEAHQHLEVWIEALGDPGNIIQDNDTGTIYASQGQAAKELGVTPSAISQQLSGKAPHVRGHTFTKLGKAMVSSEV